MCPSSIAVQGRLCFSITAAFRLLIDRRSRDVTKDGAKTSNMMSGKAKKNERYVQRKAGEKYELMKSPSENKQTARVVKRPTWRSRVYGL